MKHFTIEIHRDGEQWVAACDDLGLVTEASTYETLVARVWQIAPELYVLNGYGDAQENFCLDFHQMQEAREVMA